MKMFSPTFIIVTILPLATSSKGETSLSFLEGASIKIDCSSSFPPPWTWSAKRDGNFKTLAISGTKPHPKLNEPRYEFHQEGDSNNYFLRISDVKFQDSGKFVCDGDSYEVFIVNVLR